MIRIYFDGGTRLNKVCIFDDFANSYSVHPFDVKMTNNQLEYAALFKAVTHAFTHYDLSDCIFVGDSEVIIKQMKGEYLTVNKILKKMKQMVDGALEQKMGLPPIASMFEWVPRAENKAGVYLEKLG